jgi:drug/metabolite transporter (DMT)-like permease
MASTYGIDAITLLALRMAMSLPIFVAMSVTYELSWRRAGPPEKTPASDRAKVAALGFMGYYLASYLDFVGLTYVTASLERLLLFSYPTFTVILSAILFRVRIGRREALALGLSYVGIGLAFGAEATARGPSVVKGAACIGMSALVYAVYLVGSGRLLGRYGSTRFVAQAMTMACVAVLGHFALARPVGALFALPPVLYAYGAAIAVFTTVLPTVLLGAGMRRIGSNQAAIAGMVGPVSTIVLARIFLGERFGVLEALGTVLVLVGVAQLGLAKATPVKDAP